VRGCLTRHFITASELTCNLIWPLLVLLGSSLAILCLLAAVGHAVGLVCNAAVGCSRVFGTMRRGCNHIDRGVGLIKEPSTGRLILAV
jgi:hypothetical protein